MNYSHSQRLFDPAYAQPVTIFGVGSVGSQVACMLAKCGATDITVWDGDDVRSHNLPMSLAFGLKDIGRFKVDVVRDRALEQSGVEIKTCRQMYKDEPLKGSIVCCVDRMEARMALWKQVEMNPGVNLFIDTRTHQLFCSVFAIRPCEPEDIALYKHYLYPSSRAAKQMCGSHGIVYMTALTASLAVRALTSFWTGVIPPRLERTLLANNGTRIYNDQPGE